MSPLCSAIHSCARVENADTYMYVCICEWMYIHVCVRILHTRVERVENADTYIHIYTHSYIHTYMYIHTFMCAVRNIDTYIHIYTHTSLYIQSCARVGRVLDACCVCVCIYIIIGLFCRI